MCESSYINGDSNDAENLRLFCLTKGESIGLTLVTVAGVVSLMAVVYAFGIILRNILRASRLEEGQPRTVLAAPIDMFMLSLFVADFLQGMGGALNIKWIKEGKVEVGRFCTAQGVTQQLGETGAAISTLMIAMYTFVCVWWRTGHSPRVFLVSKVAIAAAWLFTILITALGNAKVAIKGGPSYQVPTPYWCWINERYKNLRLFGEYFWFWITLLVSILVYVLLYLWTCGVIVRTDEDPWWKFRLHWKTAGGGNLKGISGMLAYPSVYCILVLPLSLVRWIQYSRDNAHQSPMPAAATLVVVSIYYLGGISNVVLLLSTRRNTSLLGGANRNCLLVECK